MTIKIAVATLENSGIEGVGLPVVFGLEFVDCVTLGVGDVA
jgi:hypothetical protein